MATTSYKPLEIISQGEAISRANKKIYQAMVTEYPGLITRWSKVNYAVGGSFRFGEISYILGASGSGKSFFLNMMREDFAGPMNAHFPKPFKILAFTFEMGADDEVIRTYSSQMKTSYSELMSSHKKITKEYYEQIKEASVAVDNDIIYYVESTGNREQILSTVDSFHQSFPKHNLVITLDHTLLMEYLDEQGEVDLINRMSRLAIYLKKRYHACVILLGQLNDKIEQPERIANPILHYPKKTDIHGGKSVYMAADTIMIIHRPEMLQIQAYGQKHFPAQDLVALHILKSRLNGTEGVIRMRQDFAHGNLLYPYEDETNNARISDTLVV